MARRPTRACNVPKNSRPSTSRRRRYWVTFSVTLEGWSRIVSQRKHGIYSPLEILPTNPPQENLYAHKRSFESYSIFGRPFWGSFSRICYVSAENIVEKMRGQQKTAWKHWAITRVQPWGPWRFSGWCPALFFDTGTLSCMNRWMSAE